MSPTSSNQSSWVLKNAAARTMSQTLSSSFWLASHILTTYSQNQDSHDYKRIQTVIPTTHTVHHAPIVHESTEHAAISKDDFLKNGGVLGSENKNAGDLGVLHDGKCERKVDGVAEQLEQKLGLAPGATTKTTV